MDALEVRLIEIIFGLLLAAVCYFLSRLIGKFDDLTLSVNSLHTEVKTEIVKRETDSLRVDDLAKSIHKNNGRVMKIETKIAKIETIINMDK